MADEVLFKISCIHLGVLVQHGNKTIAETVIPIGRSSCQHRAKGNMQDLARIELVQQGRTIGDLLRQGSAFQLGQRRDN